MEAKQALQAQNFPVQELKLKNAQLRRNLSITEQEKSVLILENRKLMNELETLQVELASSKTKVSVLGSMVGSKTSRVSQMKEELAHLETELQAIRISHRDVGKKLKETQEVLALRNEEVKQLKEELDKQNCQSIREFQKDMEHVQALIAKADAEHFPLQKVGQPEVDLKLLLNKVTQFEKQLEDEKSLASGELQNTEQRVLEGKRDIQIHQRHTAKACSSGTQQQEEMNKFQSELDEKERELLRIHRDSGVKESPLAQMENMLQETKGMLGKKNEMVSELEEKVQRSKRERRDSLHRTQLLESQMKTVRGELVDTLDHLQALRDVLHRSQQKAEERQAAMEKLSFELREAREQVEVLRKEVKDKEETVRETENRLQQTTKELVAVQQVRAEVLKVSDRVVNASQQHLSEECSRAQLEQTYNNSAALLDEMREQEQLLQYTSEALLIKESEITRLKTRLSSIERSSDIRSDLLNITQPTQEVIRTSVFRVDQHPEPLLRSPTKAIHLGCDLPSAEIHSD